jgi:hypothetical protein
MVIAVIDRQYGKTFEDWGPYPQYKDLSPTHAEIRHALDRGKRVLIYVQDDILNFYEVWRQNPDAFKSSAPRGLEESTLKMLQELKMRHPAPWIEHFTDATDLLGSLKGELVNQLYMHLRDREKQMVDSAEYILEKIGEAAPEVRKKIEGGLNPDLVSEREVLQRRLDEIEIELRQSKDMKEKITELEQEKNDAQVRLNATTQQLTAASLMLARAAMKDASWLDFVRRTMMPKQPGRVPFHNSAEVALRGYHAAAGGRKKPTLIEVTWSKLQHNENGLHRGYYAGIIFKGADFVPGITVTNRRIGENGPPPGNSDYLWHLPNIYFGDYLEVASGDNELESPLSLRGFEFQVKNPEGETSDWVPFTYPFDIDFLWNIQRESLQRGKDLLAQGKPTEAVEPLRKAWVLSDRLQGSEHKDTLQVKSLWDKALNEAALARLRFRVGDRLVVLSDPHEGKVGVVKELLLRHLHAYFIHPDSGDDFQASDEQVERAPTD